MTKNQFCWIWWTECCHAYFAMFSPASKKLEKDPSDPSTPKMLLYCSNSFNILSTISRNDSWARRLQNYTFFQIISSIFSISVAWQTAIRTFSDEVNLIQLRSADTWRSRSHWCCTLHLALLSSALQQTVWRISTRQCRAFSARRIREESF